MEVRLGPNSIAKEHRNDSRIDILVVCENHDQSSKMSRHICMFLKSVGVNARQASSSSFIIETDEKSFRFNFIHKNQMMCGYRHDLIISTSLDRREETMKWLRACLMPCLKNTDSLFIEL